MTWYSMCMLGDDVQSIDLDTQTMDTRRRIRMFIMGGAVLAVLIASSTAGYYFYSRYRQTQFLLKNPQAAAKQEVTDTIKKVSLLIEVPVGEEPTVATVSDIEKLKDKPFFQTAQNGDKVIVYSQAKKAILYRPSTNKIVEMAPVNVPEGQQAGSGQPAVAGAVTEAPVPTGTAAITPSPTKAPVVLAPAKLIIYNGTLIAGLAADVESKVSLVPKEFTVVSTGNSVKRNYEKTLIVAVNAEYTDAAEKLQKLVGGQIDVLPEGEKPGDADIIILIGRDYQKT